MAGRQLQNVDYAKDAAAPGCSLDRGVGRVDGVNLQASPPTLSIGGADFTVDKIKRVVRAGL